MEPCIEIYCEDYSHGLSEHLGLNNNALASAISIPVLPNPVFGMEKHIIGSGLMTKKQ